MDGYSLDSKEAVAHFLLCTVESIHNQDVKDFMEFSDIYRRPRPIRYHLVPQSRSPDDYLTLETQTITRPCLHSCHYHLMLLRSEERRVGKSVDLHSRLII